MWNICWPIWIIIIFTIVCIWAGLPSLKFDFSGGVSLLILTFHNILLQREQIFENIFLLIMCVFVICIWIMVHQVREDIVSKKRKEEAETELVSLGESALAVPVGDLEDPINIV